MASIPSDGVLESSVAFLADPYRFIGRRARQLRSDVFCSRLMGRRTVCLYGPDAARVFYDTTKMKRHNAMPRRVVRTLLGVGGVQSLDGAVHRARKAMFLDIATGAGIDRLLASTARQWDLHARRWQAAGGVCLYEGAASVLSRAAYAWAGIALEEDEVARRTRDTVALFDGAGALGPRHWHARLARPRLERWLAARIERIRAGGDAPDPALPLARVALHVDADGRPMPPRVAAVELLNLVRPIVAVSVYVTFIAHALHRFRDARDGIGDDGEGVDRFVHEVRRFYPFFPAVAARTCAPFSWNGFEFPGDTRVMFDLYGTSHDGRHWHAPDEFAPGRFDGTGFDPVFALVPQGGGVHADGHRCPGEWITLALMRQATRILDTGLAYAVEGRPEIDFARLPALPEGGMRLRNVQPRHR